jgi:hypothetical protein
VTLDEALDHLYGVDADEFVAERKRLARELKDAGDAEAAAEVAKARKPTVAAWALNQLARRQRRDVDLLLDAGHRLRQAQEGVVGGEDRAAFEQAQKSERETLQRLTKLASELLGGASAQALTQISATLRTAAVSEDGRELLARGRFVTPLEAEGFDVFGALPARPRQGRTSKAEQTRQAKEELKAAKARVRDLEREVRDAEQNAAKLGAELEKAERTAESARAALAEAEREVERLDGKG